MSGTCVFSLNTDVCCEHMTIAWDVTEIGFDDMAHCKLMITINFEKDSILGTIGESAFSERDIQEVHFPSSLRTIESNAFYDCKSLETLDFDLATNLEAIGDYAFANSANLFTVDLSATQKLVSIGSHAFVSSGVCDIDLSLATNIKTLDTGAFYETKIEHLTFPSQLVTIGYICFCECQSLQSLDFSQAHSLVFIDAQCFGECHMLANTIVFPPSLEQIGESAFMYCSSIPGVVIPACSNLVSISGGAFIGCTGLVRFEIDVGGKVIDFGSWAFYDCESLAFFSCYFGSKFGESFDENHKISTVVFHGSPTKSNSAVDYMSTLVYPAKPVFLVPRGRSIEDLTVATLDFYDRVPNMCNITQQLVRNFHVLVDKKFLCPYFMCLIR